MAKTIKARIQPYQKTAAALAAENDVPLQGERVYETDTKRWKTGDGETHFNDLPYDVAEVAAGGITDLADGRALVLTGTPTQAREVIGAGDAQRARYGGRVVLDGASSTIAATTESAWNQSRGGWAMEMARLSDGRIDIVRNAAIAGTGIADRVSNFPTSVAPYNPQTVIMAPGNNDMGSGTWSAFEAGLTTYYNLIRGIGAQLILGSFYPKASQQDVAATWNANLVAWAKTRGVIVIPFWELGDPATGSYPAGWSSDGTHPDRESIAYVEMGKLAWNTISEAFTEKVAQTARFAGDGIMTNFFTDLTASITGVATITSLAATTGTLAPGFYAYRVVPRNTWGKNNGYADSTIVLESAGGVTIASNITGGSTARAVYRSDNGGPLRYIGEIAGSGSQTFTDNGLPAKYLWADGDTSRAPVGLINGSGARRTQEYGPLVRPAGPNDRVRGNILRLARLDDSSSSHIDRFLLTVVPGAPFTISVKCRGANKVNATERIRLTFRDAGDTTNIDTFMLAYHRMSDEWGLVFGTWTVPPGAERVRLSFEGDATSPYLDIAELRVS